MKIKEIREFYKKTNNFLKQNQSPELIGTPYLNPQIPRSLSLEDNRIKLNIYKRIFNFIFKFFNRSKNYNYFLDKDYKYLILSHLVSYNYLNYSNDFYFGDLAKKLNKNQVLFVLIDHIGFKNKNIKRKINGNYIILSNKLNFFSEIKLILKTFTKFFYYSLFIRNLKLFGFTNVFRSVDNQRISIQLKEILEKHKFQNLFFTYEGYPYEKLVCHEANKIDKNLRKIGYQFTVIRKFQYSLFSFINRKFDPDVIFTIGKYNEKLLKSKLKKRLDVHNFGLLKKDRINLLKKKRLNLKKIKVLVMPEGIINEIKIFLDFCVKNQNKEIEFNFRLHPIYLKNKLIYNKIDNSSSNIKISKNKLEYDIKNNDFLLYRGTAGVLNAVKSGLIPIYLHKKNQISVDPLFEVNKKHVIKDNYKLLDFIKTTFNKKKELQKELSKIKKFSQIYYDKPKHLEISKFLKKK